ncbi:MAG: DegV family protein [Lachnospiraceae bacterium]|nr:DegV family protein [Lachnospiraceae bacterium]
MSKVAILTDSNSGISQAEARELGVRVIPMPFYINDRLYFEDINLTQDEFYDMLKDGAKISTSMPSPGDTMDLWDKMLKDHDEIVYIPMSSGLSSSCHTAITLAEEYDGKVKVVDNQRISVTQRLSVLDALKMADDGANAQEIHDKLMETKLDASIYIMVDTLEYLKKGGRLTPAAAAVGTLLRLKPVLQIQGEKLDSFHNARSVKIAKKIMIEAVKADAEHRFGGADNCVFHMAYTYNRKEFDKFQQDALKEFPGRSILDFHADPLSLSVACHIGPGALAITCTTRVK